MKISTYALCMAAILLLASCGGSDTSTPSTPTAPTPPAPPAPPTYTIGGNVTGLISGTSVVLNNNAGNALTVSANGVFTFTSPVAANGTYLATVATQPAGQVCTASNNSGSAVTANITTVTVQCSALSFTISGSVTGLAAGEQLTLLNNGADPQVVTSNTAYSFVTPVAYPSSYTVSVGNQPLTQICNVTNPTGSGVTANVTDANISCSAATASIVYSFNAVPDATGASSTLLLASDGNFYGTSYGGGANGLGTVFQITPAGVETVLHSFAGGSDGSHPYGTRLTADSNGLLYGTTYQGGAHSLGTVYTITTAGVETVLYSFAGGTADGGSPLGTPLTLASDGNFYGSTSVGGASHNGVIFKITPAGVESVFYDAYFLATVGEAPENGVIQASDGNFYGTMDIGGANGKGTVFKITPAGVASVVYAFGANPDANEPGPNQPLVQGSDGNLYGVTNNSGAYNHGSIYKVTLAGVETVLFSFGSAPLYGVAPESGLLEGSDGNFYGTTSGASAYPGTIYQITPAGVLTVLYSFTGGATNGFGSYGGLTLGNDGYLYGLTTSGGANGTGIFYKF